MKGITTIAALPNGAGQAASLPAEVGETPAPVGGLYNGWGERIGDAPKREKMPWEGVPWKTAIIPQRARSADVVTHFKECRWDSAGECFVEIR
jgi:hypothetical protein